tara:strand:- start:62 stop:865 length:804 start_codon:yes stop_codon:yes gene_type:complete
MNGEVFRIEHTEAVTGIKNYSICITTYKYRFEKWLKPLVDTIKSFRPNIEVLIAINGENKQSFDEDYRKNILEYTSTKKNTFITMYPNYRGLCKLWNNLLINSTNHKVLLLNDDISITNVNFFDSLEKKIETEIRIFKINGSWSHAFMDRTFVDQLGWFDERYLSIGHEDDDFEWRFGKSTKGKNIPNVHLPNIVNHVDHDNCLIGMEKVMGKYAKFNLDFTFSQKYKVDDKNGENYGMVNRNLVCISPTPPLHMAESFYWNNRNKL